MKCICESIIIVKKKISSDFNEFMHFQPAKHEKVVLHMPPVCKYVCVPCWQLSGWTDFIHIWHLRVYPS
jgi:hypothetical protein